MEDARVADWGLQATTEGNKVFGTTVMRVQVDDGSRSGARNVWSEK